MVERISEDIEVYFSFRVRMNEKLPNAQKLPRSGLSEEKTERF